MMELLEGERAEALDAEEHAERDGGLYERYQEHGPGGHADAIFLVHVALLEHDVLYCELVARAVCPVELQKARLLVVRCEHGRVAQLLER